MHFHAFSSSNISRGVSTLLSKNKNFKVTSHFVGGDGKILLVNLNVDDVDITAVNLYAPNNSNDKIVFFKKVHAFILKNKIDNSHIIIAGDINCNVDKIKTGAGKDPLEKYFTKLMSSFNLLDMWSHCHPDKPGFTYTSTASRTFYGSRIDYLLVDKKIATNSLSCQIESPPVPDHKSLILSIKPVKRERERLMEIK